MNIEVQFINDQSEIILRLPTKEMKRPNELEDSLAILEIFCGDFGVDPELSTHDLKGMVDDAVNQNLSHLEFKIHEDGIDF